jgi:hypothetical protein
VESEADWRYEILPFMPFWAAARAAAAEQQWQFSEQCLARALMNVSVFVPSLRADDSRLEQERLDLRFVRELALRFRDEITAGQLPLQLCLLICVRLTTDKLDDLSDLGRALRDLSRIFRLDAFRSKGVLANVLGLDLIGVLDPDTVDILTAAEILWSLFESRSERDYSPVGVHYRRALENEWRNKVCPILESLRVPDVRHLRQGLLSLQKATPSVLSVLRAHFGRDNLMLDARHSKEFSKLLTIARALNEAAHPGGLNRAACRGLRDELLNERWLHRFLKAFQPLSGRDRA